MAVIKYHVPTKIIFGLDSYLRTLDLLKQEKLNNILLLTSPNSVERYGLQKGLIEPFKSEGKKVHMFQNIQKSDLATIQEAVGFSKRVDPKIIIAIGGGAVLDTAKICAALLTNKGTVANYVIKKDRTLTNRPVRLIVFPTTAGTGSEVSPFAVVWDSDKKKKYSFESEHLYPDMAIVDPKLTITMLPHLTACTGMDALTQAVEAYWARNSNPISDLFAIESIKLVLGNLETAVKKGQDIKARENMAKAALYAGLAFSNTRTTICHSISYPLTAHFDIPHGHAVSLTLAPILEFSFFSLKKEKQQTLLLVFGASNVKQAADKIRLLMKKIGLQTNLSELNIGIQDIELIIKEGFTPERANNAPRIPTKPELRKILMKIL
jgi:phosphonate metabolism-associated iron-containing alcohol dehydrogenase